MLSLLHLYHSIKKKASQYKLGYSTQSQKDLKKRYRTSEPNLDIIFYIPGYIIFEYLMLEQPVIKDNRVINDEDNLSELVTLPLFTILSILANIIDKSSKINYIIFNQIKVDETLVDDNDVYIKKYNYYINMHNLTSFCYIEQKQIPHTILEQLVIDKDDEWTVKDLKSYLRTKLKCTVDPFATKIEMLKMLDNYLTSYNKGCLYSDKFSAYCGHQFTQQQLLTNFDNIFIF